MKLSVIIPAYAEPYLQKTVDSLLESSVLGKDLEIIAVLDGPWLRSPLRQDPRVRVVETPHFGLRPAINAGLAIAQGEFVMKVDAHCAFGPEFDRLMVENCADNWVSVPRRYSLEESSWRPARLGHPRDYHYLNYPVWVEDYGYSMAAYHWDRRGVRTPDIDDTLIFQGSCWMVNRRYFDGLIGKLDDSKKTYGPYWFEYLEVGLKYWLTGGEVKVNKKTWYAHLVKKERHYEQGQGRHYKTGFSLIPYGTWAVKHWLNNHEPGITKSFQWLIEKFWPVPTWPEERGKWVI